MKILKLRLSNLNSLVGEWQIDFTDPAYADDGIFAITGPTGAGKSTLLDAMCLALYGATPRLGKVTKSDNELMSRHTGECFAELTFATAQGVYRCYWYQHRGRRNAANPLQTQRHELVDATSGKILEAKVSSVPDAVEQLTGLDFTRFTRSMLLAQGEFAAFLHASDNERSAILEQITGTAIYADLSRATYARTKEESDKLQQLRTELEQVDLLDAEALEDLQRRHRELHSRAAVTDKALEKARQSQQWVERLSELNEEGTRLAEANEALQDEIVAFEPQQSRLNKDAQARPLLADYRELTLQQKRVKEIREALLQLTASKPKVVAERAEAEQLQVKREAASREARQALQTWQPKLRQARALDVELHTLQNRRRAVTTELNDAEGQLENEKRRQAEVQTQIQRLGDELEKSSVWVTEHSQLASLAGDLPVLESQLSQLQRLQAQRDKHKEDEAGVTQSLQELLSLPLADTHARKLTEAEDKLAAAKSLLQARQENAQLAAAVASLQAEREHLQQGQPCPLCGATEHPYVDQNETPPAAASSAVEQAREDYEESLNQLQQLRLEQVISGSERDNQLQRLKEKQTELKQAAEMLQQEQTSLVAQLSEKVARYGLDLPPVGELENCLPRLQARADEWQRVAHQREQQERELSQAQARQDGQKQVLEQNRIQVTKLTEQQNSLADDYKQKQEQRQTLLQETDTDLFEQQLELAARDAEEHHEKAREKVREVTLRLQRLQDEEKRLEASESSEKANLEKLQDSFTTALQQNGFASLTAYQEALIEDRERTDLEARGKALQQRRSELKLRQDNHAAEVRKAQAKQPDDPAAVAQELYRLRAESAELHREQGGIEQTLREQEARTLAAAEKQQQVKQQRREYERWSKLSDLIGSADGKKYRNFAQGLTFEVMVELANNKLRRMTDRYLLQRDAEAPLQLNVIDDYQAGEVRSTKNLSGGESFIVSLALALGLSQMSSQKVRVDSLFLDEGFGTLDEEALDVALDTLSSLQQDGKVIGVISHVATLKERIATQIQVHSGSGGRSSLQGPGVQKLSEANG